MSPKVWEASGHLEVFTDPLVECLNCHQRFRADHLPEPPVVPELRADRVHRAEELPPDVQDEHGSGRGRRRTPCTCAPRRRRRCSWTSRTIQQVRRKKIPFGIAQIGTSFRNEITPGNFIFRTARVRADGDGVLRRAGHRRGVARVLDRRSACAGGRRSRAPRGEPPRSASTTPTSCPTTRSAPSTSSTGSRSRTGASSRGSRTGPTST